METKAWNKENVHSMREKQVSLMISQCELLSMFSLMVRNLSMQSNAPAHLCLLEGIE